MAVERHNLRKSSTEFAALSISHPALYGLLSKTMGLQSRIDPSAGYGVMQIPNMTLALFQAEKFSEADKKQFTKLFRGFRHTPIRLYVIVRAYGARALSIEALRECMGEQRHPNYAILVHGIAKVDPTFRTAEVAQLLLAG